MSPLNYTGNKFRILSQIQPHFPKSIGTMVDMFCGGATVGLNTECKKVIFIDNDKHVISLLEFLARVSFDELLFNLEELINEYGLSYSAKYGYSYYKNLIFDSNYNNGLKEYNYEGYYQLRADYNALSNKFNDCANTMLYLLMLYAFNNDLRFSKSGYFNLPVGKTDLNKKNIIKLQNYMTRMRSIKADFICADFSLAELDTTLMNADFIYMDPPYLITDAVYNESGKWSSKEEYELLELLNEFLNCNKDFVLSNVIEKHDICNEPLMCWTEETKNQIDIIDINYNYRSASYNKKNRDSNEREIIIKPKRVSI